MPASNSSGQEDQPDQEPEIPITPLADGHPNKVSNHDVVPENPIPDDPEEVPIPDDPEEVPIPDDDHDDDDDDDDDLVVKVC